MTKEELYRALIGQWPDFRLVWSRGKDGGRVVSATWMGGEGNPQSATLVTQPDFKSDPERVLLEACYAITGGREAS